MRALIRLSFFTSFPLVNLILRPQVKNDTNAKNNAITASRKFPLSNIMIAAKQQMKKPRKPLISLSSR
jgi:hypothetical protein